MQFYRYWAKATIQIHKEGQSFPIICKRGYSISLEDAQTKAEEAVRIAADRIHAGHGLASYAYGERAMAEEILQEINGAEGQPMAVLSRNTYGAVVLNVEKVFFADLDFAPSGVWERIMRFFGRDCPTPEEKAMATVWTWWREHTDWSFRVYRTFKGFRLLATHRTFDPESPEVQTCLTGLGSDRLFIKLCKAQKCFRARLSPKPWRLGLGKPPATFPREHPDERASFQSWQSAYDQASKEYATCRFVTIVGTETMHPQIEPIVRLHDSWTRADSASPLA
jgi:hypothetical protein